jgi:hypothetical protein
MKMLIKPTLYLLRSLSLSFIDRIIEKFDHYLGEKLEALG